MCRRLSSYNSDAAFDYRKTIVSIVCTIVAGIVSLKNLVYVASPYIWVASHHGSKVIKALLAYSNTGDNL
jgi:hypothetical protein